MRPEIHSGDLCGSLAFSLSAANVKRKMKLCPAGRTGCSEFRLLAIGLFCGFENRLLSKLPIAILPATLTYLFCDLPHFLTANFLCLFPWLLFHAGDPCNIALVVHSLLDDCPAMRSRIKELDLASAVPPVPTFLRTVSPNSVRRLANRVLTTAKHFSGKKERD